MKLVDKHVLRELIGPFVFGVTAFTSVFFAGTYLFKLTNWVMNGMPVVTAIEAIVMVLPSVLKFTLPMSMLLAVLLGVGRLSGDSEIVALYASGVSFYRIAAPIVCLGVVVSASSVALNELVSPQAYDRFREIQAAVMKQESPAGQAFTIPDGSTNSLISVKGGMEVEKSADGPDTAILRDVTVTQFTGNEPRLVIFATKGVWEGMTDDSRKFRWRLYGGWMANVGSDFRAVQTFDKFRSHEIEIGKGPKEFALYRRSVTRDTDQLSFKELGQLVKYIRANPDRPEEKIRQLEVDRWNRLAFPISSLVFAMLAAPLGIRSHRSSSSVGFGLSILLIFLYWMVWNYTSSLATEGNLAPAAGAFLADVLGVFVAVMLVRRAAK